MNLNRAEISTKNNLVPVIETDIFSHNENMRFALASISPEDVLACESGSIAQAYLRLRANVYIDQTKFLGSEMKRSDGTEIDENDERSTHLVVLENLIGKSAIFACMRVIEKSGLNNQLLPIEEFFEDAFVDEKAPDNSVEISRFIVRHDEKIRVIDAKKMLISGALARMSDQSLGPVYAVVETNLERDLRMMKIPTKRLAEPKLVPEYNTMNLGVEIDRFATRQRMGEQAFSGAMVAVKNGLYFW